MTQDRRTSPLAASETEPLMLSPVADRNFSRLDMYHGPSRSKSAESSLSIYPSWEAHTGEVSR